MNPTPLALITLALLLAGVGLGVTLIQTRRELGKLRRANRRLTRLVAAIPSNIEELSMPPSYKRDK